MFIISIFFVLDRFNSGDDDDTAVAVAVATDAIVIVVGFTTIVKSSFNVRCWCGGNIVQ